MNLDAEVAFRLAQAQQAVTDAHALFRHKGLDIQSKVMLVRSLILSKLLYAAETWLNPSSVHTDKLEAFAMRVYRLILRKQNRRDQAHTTDRDIWTELEAPRVCDLLRIARLRHFGKIVSDAPDLLKAVLWDQYVKEPNSWYRMLHADLAWLQQRFRSLRQMPSPDEHLQDWMHFARARPKRWRSLCTTALRKAILQNKIENQIEQWTEDMDSLFGNAAVPNDAPSSVGQHVCDRCTATFHSHKDLMVHQLLAHSVHAYVRRYMPHPTVCGGCHRDFGGAQKLRQHLQYAANGCLAKLERIWFALTDEEIEAVQTVKLKQVRTQHRQPALLLAGPQLPDRDDWARAAPHKQFPNIQQPQPPQVAASCRERFLEVADWIHNDQGQTTLDEWFGEPVTPAEVAQIAEAASAFAEDADHAHAAHSVLQWCDSKQPPKKSGPSMQQAALPATLPKYQNQYFVLYLYSGHLREGDVHEQTRILSEKYNFLVQIIPVDVIFHASLCDLRRKASQQYWIEMVKKGLILGIISAPPCETWSAARFLAILMNDRGPPPVRSAQHPWFLIHSSVRHLKQVMVSNELLCFWMKLALIAIGNGTAWVMEHPSEPVHLVEAPSIWRLKQMEQLRAVPGVVGHLILQGYYGSASAKPTQLLAYGLQSMAESLHRWRLPSVNRAAWITLQGRDSSGRFKTSFAKAYPPRLNGSLVECFYQRAIQLEATVSSGQLDFNPLLCTVADIVKAMAVSGRQMGADFAG
eukprot:Skav222518  [mRNA]  locus=scaffold2265:339374:341617:- [translate_table: standard]